MDRIDKYAQNIVRLENFERLLRLSQEAEKLNQIPKVIHKIWWQSLDQLPEKYVQPLISWSAANPDWQIVVWDKQQIHKLLELYFSEHLILFEGYPRMIQKIDAAKYFILSKFGGCYSDMDQCCLQPLSRAVNIETETAKILVSPMTEKRSLIPLASGFSFSEPPFFNNAFIISRSGQETWGTVFKQLHIQRADKRFRNRSLLNRNPEVKVLRTTGPVCFTKALRKIIRDEIRSCRRTEKEGSCVVKVLDPQLVEPYSIYFKLGDPRYFDGLIATIRARNKAIAVSSMPSSWTNAQSRKGVKFMLLRKCIQLAYNKDLKDVMLNRSLQLHA